MERSSGQKSHAIPACHDSTENKAEAIFDIIPTLCNYKGHSSCTIAVVKSL